MTEIQAEATPPENTVDQNLQTGSSAEAPEESVAHAEDDPNEAAPLVLDRVVDDAAGHAEPQAPVRHEQPQQRLQGRRIHLWRTVLIVVALAAATVGGYAIYQHWPTLTQQTPIPAKFAAWGQTCGPDLRVCGGDLVIFNDGRPPWRVEGTRHDDAMFQDVAAARYASVTDIVSVDDAGYVDAVRVYYGRPAPQAQVIHDELPPLPTLAPAAPQTP